MNSADNKTVLVIDDNDVDREAISRLVRHRYRVDHADSGTHGIERIIQGCPDCVLLDYRLPDLDGVEVLARVKDLGSPVIILTGQGNEVLAVRSLQEGAEDYLVKKDLKRETLEAAIEAAIQKHAFKQELERYRKVIAHMPLGLAFLQQLAPARGNPEGHFEIQSINEQGLESFKLKPDEVENKDINRLFPALPQTEVVPILQKALRERVAVELPLQHYSDERLPDTWWEAVAIPLDKDSLAVLVKEVTERVRGEQEREALEHQMRASQRMESLGRLAGGIAHDFNNILTVIQSYAGFVEDQLPSGSPAAEDLKTVREAAGKAANLTSQMLAFSRRQIQNLEILNLNETIAEFDKMLRRVLGEDVTIELQLAPDLHSIRSDQTQLEQVLMNIMVNARDAMEGGGTLTVETSNQYLDRKYVDSRGAEVSPGEYVQLVVSDTGSGMDDSTKSRIFEPFFTTKEKGRGTGLGLSTVYGIVKQNKGFIWVYSEPGKGTTFKIYLPRVDDTGKVRRGRARSTSSLGGSELILLVEDDDALRGAAVRILERKGYQVRAASSGEQAIELANDEAPSLLLTDVVMAGLNGRETATAIQKTLPNLPVVYMSGYTDNAIVHHGVLDKECRLVQKPFTREELLREVRQALDEAKKRE